jgi:hypothetical protein
MGRRACAPCLGPAKRDLAQAGEALQRAGTETGEYYWLFSNRLHKIRQGILCKVTSGT